MSGSFVFMDISFSNDPPQRLVIELSSKKSKAVENFRALCAGDMGIGKTTGKPLHYKGCLFYRVFKGFAVEGGDFENQDGTGGESIHGGTFLVKNEYKARSGRGRVMMTDHGAPHRIGSQFYICLTHYAPVDGFNVAVGNVIKGLEILEKFDQLIVFSLKPLERVEITDCGEISLDAVTVSAKPSSGFVFATKNEKLEAKLKLKNDSDVTNGIDREVRLSDERLEATLKLKNDSGVTNGNDREVRSEKPSSSNPHQHSDDSSKSRNRSKKSESPISKSEFIELKQNVKELTFQVCNLVEDQKKKRRADLLVIALSYVTTVLVGAFFYQKAK